MKVKLKELCDTHEKEYLCGGLGITEEDVDWMLDKMLSMYDALEFYSNRENYSFWTDSSNNCPTSNVLFDDGYRARRILDLEETE